MKLKIQWFIGLSFLITVSSGCIFGGSSLPEHPAKLIFMWSSDGGMVPQSENVYISKDSSYWLSRIEGNSQKVYFTVNADELDSLYKVFVDNAFDKIKIDEEQEVYDRGGTSISVDVDNQYYGKSNSGMSFVAKKYGDNYNNVEYALLELVHQKLGEKKINCTVKLDTSIDTALYYVQLSVADQLVYNSEKEVKEKPEFNLQVLPGVNKIEIYLSYKDSLDSYGGHARYGSQELFYEITENNNNCIIQQGETGFSVKTENE